MRDFWMIYAKKTVFAFLMLFAISAVSCDGIYGYSRDNISRPFFADISGEIDGVGIYAKIYCDPSEHKTKEIYEKLIVTFDSPEGLDGVTVTLLSSGEGFVRFENVISKDPYYAPMTDMFSSLFISGDPLSVQKESNGDLSVRYKNSGRDITYTFDEKYTPKEINGTQNGRKIAFKLTNVQIKDEK